MPARQASTTRSGPDVTNIGAATAGMRRRPSNAAGIGTNSSLRWEDGDGGLPPGADLFRLAALRQGRWFPLRKALSGAIRVAYKCSVEITAFKEAQIRLSDRHVLVSRQEWIAVA